jgi:subtilisin family serine protease
MCVVVAVYCVSGGERAAQDDWGGGKQYLEQPFIFYPAVQRPAFDPWRPSGPGGDFGGMGMPVQADCLVLQVKPKTSSRDVSALFRKYELSVETTVSSIGFFVVRAKERRSSTPRKRAESDAKKHGYNETLAGLSALNDLIARLEKEKIVRAVALNLLLGTAEKPKLRYPDTPVISVPDQTGKKDFVWGWSDDAEETGSRDASYAQQLIRMPAAWNLNDAIRARGRPQVRVGVLDVGFGRHEDLSIPDTLFTNHEPSDHGTHVAGTIGASFDNAKGVNGISPFVELCLFSAAHPHETSSMRLRESYLIFSDVVSSLARLVQQSEENDLRVINVSLAYNWSRNYSLNPNDVPTIQKIVRSHGLIMQSLADLAARKGVIIVSPAGNDSRPNYRRGKFTKGEMPIARADAKWSSPLNWAALNVEDREAPARNIIVVESIGPQGDISRFSSVHGCLSAPGEDILSTVAFDPLGRLSRDSYGVRSGTSHAAAHVSGVIAQMYAYNPELSMDRVLRILNVWDTNRPAQSIPAPTVDGFEALLACREDSLKDLADLNVDRRVDMGDFELFRQSLWQVEGRSGVRRRDLNGDGIISKDENVWPRADLNGSGKLSRDRGDLRKIRGKVLSDLGVMMEVWEDNSINPEALPGMLN